MPQITNARVREILDVLDESYFTSAGFLASFPDDTQTLAMIQFRDNSKYAFYLKDAFSNRYEVRYTPGDIKISTETRVESFQECLELLEGWTKNIKTELAASSPFYDELENLKKEFSDKLNAHVADSQQHFSKQEVEELKTRLDELAKNFVQLQKDQIITAQELEVAKQTLAELRNDLTALPKKTWYRTAGSKIIELAGKVITSEQGQKMLGKVADRLLDAPKPPGS